jgi:hypothetical protein
MKHILTGNQKAAVVGEQKSMLSSESKIVAHRTALLSILMLLVMTASAASSVEGYWKSVDEQTGKASGGIAKLTYRSQQIPRNSY